MNLRNYNNPFISHLENQKRGYEEAISKIDESLNRICQPIKIESLVCVSCGFDEQGRYISERYPATSYSDSSAVSALFDQYYLYDTPLITSNPVDYLQLFIETGNSHYYFLYQELLAALIRGTEEFILKKKKEKYFKKISSIEKKLSTYNYLINIREQFRGIFHFLFKNLSGHSDEDDLLFVFSTLDNFKTTHLILITNEKKYSYTCNKIHRRNY